MATTVELTAVTLGDDCGAGAAPITAPKAKGQPQKTQKADAKSEFASERRRCDQTSMQLSITTTDAAAITVKSVELFDETGTSVGHLTANKPTKWSETNAVYEAWDEKVSAGSTTSVSYFLSMPEWGRIGDRWNKTFRLETVISIGGVDTTARKEFVLTAPSSLPPGVKT